MKPQIEIPQNKIKAFCNKWKITEFSLFGSVMRDDFGPKSDVDILITFDPSAKWKLGDWFDMEDELEAIFGRDIDLLTRPSVEYMENYLRRRSILSTATSIYAR